MVIQLVRIRDTRHVQGVCSGNESPERASIYLVYDILGNTIAPCAPSCWDLASDGATEHDRLRNVHACAFLQLDEPLLPVRNPDVTLVTVLVLESLRFFPGHFKRLQVVDELDFLVEALLLGVVPSENFGFYKYVSESDLS